MPDLQISRRAASDLAEIADYTIAEFGIEQARKYRDLLQSCFQSLLENPGLGRSAEELAPGLRRSGSRPMSSFIGRPAARF
nr:type II toxin-antitoxin system RelE/ParE family toxin [Croceicoccus marinus]